MKQPAAGPVCLGCGYSRHGLGNEVACPECGHEGTAVSGIAFGGALSLRTHARIRGGWQALIGLGSLGPILIAIRGASTAHIAITVAGGLLAAFGAWMLRRSYASDGPCRGTWVVADGALYQIWRGSSFFAQSWSGVKDVSRHYIPLCGWSVRVSLAPKGTVLALLVPTSAAAREIVDEITRHLHRASTHHSAIEDVAAADEALVHTVFLMPGLESVCTSCGLQRPAHRAFGPCPVCGAEGARSDDRHALGRRAPLSPLRGPIGLIVATAVAVPLAVWAGGRFAWRDANALYVLHVWAAATSTLFLCVGLILCWHRRNAVDLYVGAVTRGVVLWCTRTCRLASLTWPEISAAEVGRRRGRWRELILHSQHSPALVAWLNAQDVDVVALATHLTQRARREAESSARGGHAAAPGTVG